MIRRDYILQAIEECIQVLTNIRALRHGGRWEEARQAVDAQCEKLAADGAQKLASLSEIELMARFMEDQPTTSVRPRLFLMIALLQEAGEIAVAEGRIADAREVFLKALHLLLEVSAQEEGGAHPAYVPSVDALLLSLEGAPLTVHTQALLMRHFESTGQWAKAEDTLFAILDATGNDAGNIEFARSFYQRLFSRSDAILAAGNLPRPEAEEGLRELQRRAAKL